MDKHSAKREFARYASLNMLGMLGISCYILADTFFISRATGAQGLAALNLALPVYSLIHGLGLMLGMGGGIRYSIGRGQGDKQSGDGAFTQALCLALFLGALFSITGLTFARPLAQILGAQGEVLQMSSSYLRVLMVFAPAFMLNDVFTCFVRNDGDPRRAMAAMLGGSLSNILLDYIFIFPCGLGIFGAALATGAAPLIGIAILSPHWLSKKSGFHFCWQEGKKAPLLQLVLLGIPSLVPEISSGVVIAVFNTILLSLQGDVAVAAYGVVANLSLVAVAVLTGLSQGMQPILSRAYGARDKDNLRHILFLGLIWSLAAALLMEAVLTLGAQPLTGVFNSEGNALLQQMASFGLRLYFIALSFVGINTVASTYFAATQRAMPAHVISLSRGLVLIVPMAFLLSKLWDLTGVWLTFPVTEGLVAVFSLFLLWKGRDSFPQE